MPQGPPGTPVPTDQAGATNGTASLVGGAGVRYAAFRQFYSTPGKGLWVEPEKWLSPQVEAIYKIDVQGRIAGGALLDQVGKMTLEIDGTAVSTISSSTFKNGVDFHMNMSITWIGPIPAGTDVQVGLLLEGVEDGEAGGVNITIEEMAYAHRALVPIA